MTSEAGLWNIANVLTMVRIILVPVFVGFLLAGGTAWRLAALATFCVASLTDLLDGRLARSRGLVTDFGKIADPVADKALTGAALICLSALGELPWWVTGVIMFRELGVTALRFWVIRRGVIAASRGGKAKTLLQVIAICLYVLPGALSPPAIVRELFMAAAVVVTVVTGVDTCYRRCGSVVHNRGVQNRPRAGEGSGLGGGRIVVVGSGSSAGDAARDLASQVLDRLRAGGQTVAVAESLTGGLVAAALTDVPGSSAAFRGGVVAYATELKADLLGVDAVMLRRHGAVYPAVAAAMAEGVRARLGATYGVATTGVAGPDPSDGQPVGTAHIAVSVADDTVVRTIALTGDRHEIRRLTVEHALGLLLGRLREESY